MELRSILPIKKGEQIFTRYTPPELVSLKRQSLLQTQWYFSCDCRRCVDPTECGTMGNAIKCCFPHEEDDSSTNEYYMLPKNPRDLDSEWMCISDPTHIADHKYPKETITEVENSIKAAGKVSRVCYNYNQL